MSSMFIMWNICSLYVISGWDMFMICHYCLTYIHHTLHMFIIYHIFSSYVNSHSFILIKKNLMSIFRKCNFRLTYIHLCSLYITQFHNMSVQAKEIFTIILWCSKYVISGLSILTTCHPCSSCHLMLRYVQYMSHNREFLEQPASPIPYAGHDVVLTTKMQALWRCTKCVSITYPDSGSW